MRTLLFPGPHAPTVGRRPPPDKPSTRLGKFAVNPPVELARQVLEKQGNVVLVEGAPESFGEAKPENRAGREPAAYGRPRFILRAATMVSHVFGSASGTLPKKKDPESWLVRAFRIFS